MSKLIPDRDIRELIGNVLIDADENCLNPNGIELRLGRHVYFHFQQLKEAGYPFNYISTELVELHGNLETVSKDFGILKRAIDHLSDKIETETETLTDKIQEGQQNLMEKVENLFSKKFNITAGVIIGALTIIAGAITFFLESNVDHNALAIGTAVAGIAIIVLTLIINTNQQK